MSFDALERVPQIDGTVESDPFDLDVRVIEFGDGAVPLINLTDDGCGSSCPRACATNLA